MLYDILALVFTALVVLALLCGYLIDRWGFGEADHHSI